MGLAPGCHPESPARDLCLGGGWHGVAEVPQCPQDASPVLDIASGNKWDASLLIYLGNVTYCYKKKYRMIWFKFSVNTTFSK